MRALRMVLPVAMFFLTSTVSRANPAGVLIAELAREVMFGIASETGGIIAQRMFQVDADGNEVCNVKAIEERLVAIESVSGEQASLIRELRYSIDGKTSKAVFNAMVKATEARIAGLEAQQARFAAELSRQSDRISDVAYQAKLLRADLNNAVRDLKVELGQLATGLSDERLARRLADEKLAGELEQAKGRLSRLENLISPKTRAQTASMLGGNGASLIVSNGDTMEAIRTLRLAIAYDATVNAHPDPASRYFLAVAYRRAGRTDRADEMLTEAVVAERFRAQPEWWHRLAERFQGPERLWLESARKDLRYGVTAPRNVLYLNDDRNVKEVVKPVPSAS